MSITLTSPLRLACNGDFLTRAPRRTERCFTLLQFFLLQFFLLQFFLLHHQLGAIGGAMSILAHIDDHRASWSAISFPIYPLLRAV